MSFGAVHGISGGDFADSPFRRRQVSSIGVMAFSASARRFHTLALDQGDALHGQVEETIAPMSRSYSDLPRSDAVEAAAALLGVLPVPAHEIT